MGKDLHPTEKMGRNPELAVADKESDSSVSKKSEESSKVPKFNFKGIGTKIRGMNRSAKLACVLAAVLLVVGVSAFLLTRKNNSNADNEQAGIQEMEQADSLGATVTLQEGTLEIKKDQEWIDVEPNLELKPGDVLRTVGATSRSVITFEGGDELRIDANSEVELQTLTSSRIVIKHTAGYTYNRVVPSETLTYVVSSDDAQYEAKGTAFKTNTTGDEQAVEVYESSVLETSTNKTVKQGEKLTVKSETDPSKNGKVEKLDIEVVKNDAFLQWNRDLDLKSDKFKASIGFLGDVTAPEITINTTDGQTILLDPAATEGTIEFSGTTEKGAKVTVQSKSQAGAEAVEAIVDANGGFTTPVISAPLGSATFEFITKDKAGNATTKSIRVTFQRKSQSTATSGISLSGQLNTSDNKVSLNWATTGTATTPDGVKIVYSKSENPVYTNPATAGVTSKGDSGTSTSIKSSDLAYGKGTYYFKICIYDSASGTCGVYSNQVTIVIP